MHFPHKFSSLGIVSHLTPQFPVKSVKLVYLLLLKILLVVLLLMDCYKTQQKSWYFIFIYEYF